MNWFGWLSVTVVGTLTTAVCIMEQAWPQLAVFWVLVGVGIYASYKNRGKRP